jgi:hypothetical protein
MRTWILTRCINAYDQEGEYFAGCFNKLGDIYQAISPKLLGRLDGEYAWYHAHLVEIGTTWKEEDGMKLEDIDKINKLHGELQACTAMIDSMEVDTDLWAAVEHGEGSCKLPTNVVLPVLKERQTLLVVGLKSFGVAVE